MRKKIKKAIPVRYHDDGLSQLRPNAGRIDIGASEVWVDVGNKDAEPTRMFETFTADLNRMGDWLKSCGIETVAMESTGVFWIPVCQILESKGIEVYLVNARQAKNVSGRKSDILDCQWLRILHSYGLLPASFRPAKDIGVLRSYMRHRQMLIEYGAAHIQHMQKALTQMNLQLHHVISDITGSTGLAILDAVVAGERDVNKLAHLRDPRIRATKETIAKSLVGDYRPEHLFTLRQSVNLYRTYQKEIAECETEIQRFLRHLETKVDPVAEPLPPAKDSVKKCTVMPPVRALALREEGYRVLGVVLTTIPGMSVVHVQAVVAEVGPDLSKFRSA